MSQKKKKCDKGDTYLISYRKTPKSKIEPIDEDLYNSWLDSAYSPEGEIVIDISIKDINAYQNTDNKLWITKVKSFQLLKEQNPYFFKGEFQCQIKCILRMNRFEEWNVSISPMDSLPDIDTGTLADIIWGKAFKQFNYDCTRIIPETVGWKSQVTKSYQSERLKEEHISNYGKVPERYIKDINNVLLAFEFSIYLDYPLTRDNAYKIISNPALFRSYENFIDNKNKPVDKKAYQNVRQAINRIPEDIFGRTNKGSNKTGRLTDFGSEILYDYLRFIGVKGFEEPQNKNLRNKVVR